MDQTTNTFRKIAAETRTIVMAGASPNPARPSFGVMRFLQGHGYRVIPVNPGQEGQIINGEPAFADVASIPADVGEVQMLDLFVRSDRVLPIVKEALIALRPRGLRTVWMQIGVVDEEAAALARQAGLEVVMDRCPKIEWSRYL
jgi:uncharacterized protein